MYNVDIAGRSSAKGWVGKQAIFEIMLNISKTIGDICPKLILMTNMKLHIDTKIDDFGIFWMT